MPAQQLLAIPAPLHRWHSPAKFQSSIAQPFVPRKKLIRKTNPKGIPNAARNRSSKKFNSKNESKIHPFLYGNYIEEIVAEGHALPPLKSSALNQTLEARGYTTIVFENRSRGQFDLKEDVRLALNLLSPPSSAAFVRQVALRTDL